MEKSVRVLIQRSIDEKWKLIFEGTKEDQGSNDCPLCEEFLYNRDPKVIGVCEGCPIAMKTGDTMCVGSPYFEWQQLCESDPHTDYADTPLKKTQAGLMIEFLKSLLEDE